MEWISKVIPQAQTWYLDFLIDPSFEGVNRLFALSFEDGNYLESYTKDIIFQL